MLNWNDPKIEELTIQNTEQGGSDYTVIDYSWKDAKTGLAYSSYES